MKLRSLTTHSEFVRSLQLASYTLLGLCAWISGLIAFEIKLFPASEAFDHDVEYLHERLGVKGQALKVEDFEDDALQNWLRTNIKGGGLATEQADWDCHSASVAADMAKFIIDLPRVRFFGIGLSDNDGGNERISINGGPSVLLRKLPGHAGNGAGRAFFALVVAEPNDADIKSVVFDDCFTVNFDHLFVIEDKKPSQPEKLLPRLVLRLVDGTRLVAHSRADSIKVSVGGENLDLAFERVSSMQFQQNSKTASVILKNGEKMSCQVRFSELKVITHPGRSVASSRKNYLSEGYTTWSISAQT